MKCAAHNVLIADGRFFDSPKSGHVTQNYFGCVVEREESHIKPIPEVFID